MLTCLCIVLVPLSKLLRGLLREPHRKLARSLAARAAEVSPDAVTGTSICGVSVLMVPPRCCRDTRREVSMTEEIRACYSCALGLYAECLDPEAKEDGTIIPCGIRFAVDDSPVGTRTDGVVNPDDVTDTLSTGRKRAALVAPIMDGMTCEWAGLKYAGGGAIPMIGCAGNLISDKKGGKPDEGYLQGDRHHGPDKATLNNAVGQNLHRVCKVCVAPHTRILMADLTWKAAGDIEIGEEIYGFDEDLKTLGSKKATVTANSRVIEPSYRLHMANGDELISSHAHQWVASLPGDAHIAWKTTESFATKRSSRNYTLRKFVDVWEVADTYEAGWLAGMLDGEGCFSSRALSIGQTVDGSNGIVADKMIEAFEHYSPKRVNLSHRAANERERPAVIARITNLADILMLLGKVRPARLLSKVWGQIEGLKPMRRGNAIEIEHVEFLGDQEVVVLETTSKTFIAEGYLSHNCHNRWHTLNDPFYEGDRPKAARPWLPGVDYYLHDANTEATIEEQEAVELWWQTPTVKRKGYPNPVTGLRKITP